MDNIPRARGTARRMFCSPYWRRCSKDRMAMSQPNSSAMAIKAIPKTAGAWWFSPFSKWSPHILSRACTCIWNEDIWTHHIHKHSKQSWPLPEEYYYFLTHFYIFIENVNWRNSKLHDCEQGKGIATFRTLPVPAYAQVSMVTRQYLEIFSFNVLATSIVACAASYKIRTIHSKIRWIVPRCPPWHTVLQWTLINIIKLCQHNNSFKYIASLVACFQR
jgi:hypothetical protein